MKRIPLLGSFAVLFFASGFSGLIYESVWTHYLKLFLGNAAYAQTLVLAIFMGGMAGGAAWCARRSTSFGDPLMGYALAEGVVGLAALVFHPIFVWTTGLAYSSVMPALGSPVLSSVFKWLLGAALILPQSVLLGATFPLMTAGVLRRHPEQPGSLVSLLYFVNSLGGAAGVLVSAFVLIGSMGLPGTLRVAGLMNLAVAAGVGALAWAAPGRRPVTAAPAPEAVLPVRRKKGEPAAGPAIDARYIRLLLAAAALTGFASFAYEVGWIRMLALVLGGTTHAFETMLSAFILGLALGGWWIRGRIDRLGDPLRMLAGVQVAMGLLALATLPVYGKTFGVMDWVLGILSRTPEAYRAFEGFSHAIALGVMLPATFCAGMTLPLITAALLGRGRGEGSIGAVYAANTLGAIVAVFFAVHVGMPVLGLKGLIVFGAAVDLGLGVMLLRRASGISPGFTAATGTVCVLALAGTMLFAKLDVRLMASGVYRTGAALPPAAKVLFHKDGKTATVDLVHDGQSTSIRTNGKTDAGISLDPNAPPNIDESMMILLGAAVPAFQPGARTVANIGMGSGLSTHILLAVPTIERVDTIEIEPAMVEAARGFAPRNSRAYDDPRSRIHIDDAKSFFSTRRSRYDAIVSEPSNPWVSGVASLFSVEFYARIGDHLNDGGLFVQWLQLYEIDGPAVASVLKALTPHFTDFRIYAANQADVLIVARKGGPVGSADPGMFDNAILVGELVPAGIAGLDDLEARRIGSRAALEPWIRKYPVPANSDYHPYLDQRAGMTRFLASSAKEVVGLREVGLPAIEMLDGETAVDSDRLTRWAGLQRLLLIRSAVAVRDYLLGRSPSIADTAVVDRLRQDAAAFRARLSECTESGAFMDGAYRMAIALNPHLPPDQAVAVWDVVLGQPCITQFGIGSNEWLKLFRAVAARDAAEMASRGVNIVRSADKLPQGPAEYALGAAMLGLIVEGRREEALQLWNEFSPRMLQGNASTLLQLLVAHAGTGA